VLDLNFPLLSDWNGDAARAFGITREFRGLRDVPERSIYLVRDGRIAHAWRYEDAEVPDVDELLAAARG
jgi:peroxiredoxin